MENVTKRLYSQLEERGLQGRVVSIQHLPDLQRDIQGRQAQGLFDAEFYQERLAWFVFRPPDDFPTAASLVVVAVPRPQTRVHFTWNGKRLALVLPPTYAGYQAVHQQVGELLAECLAPVGYRVAPARLPLKLLAVRSGLGDYGRNNIGYVPGMGSFFQLAAFYSDLPAEADHWREPRIMEACHTCQACVRHCLARAIPSDHFLLRAERCLVFHNERPAAYPFPSWMDVAAHDCLVGCMRCQRICPENTPFREWFEGEEAFSQEETALLLEGVSADQLPPATLKKLERLELVDSLDILPRNLGVFLGGQ